MCPHSLSITTIGGGLFILVPPCKCHGIQDVVSRAVVCFPKGESLREDIQLHVGTNPIHLRN